MKLTKRIAFLSILFLLIAPAFSQEIHYNYDHSANFMAYRTYQWLEIPGANAPDQLVDQDIRRAIDQQLALKGMVKVNEDADLLVGYVAVVREQTNIDLSRMGGGPLWLGSGTVQGQTSTTPVGTLVVILHDPEREQLVWRGDVSKTLDLKKDPDKNYRALQKALTKLFQNYPPRIGK